jgi:hypothetical protein
MCPVYEVSFNIVDPFGNALVNTRLTLRRFWRTWGRTTYFGPYIFLETDDMGKISTLLSGGLYEVKCSKTIYIKKATLQITGDSENTIEAHIKIDIWLLGFFVTLPLIGLSIVMERKRVMKPKEIRKYKKMLLQLESMYKSETVEFRIYKKIKEEYETKLMQLGGRGIR